MDEKIVNIRVDIPELVELQDLIDNHYRLVREMWSHLREIGGLSLSISFEMKETADINQQSPQ